MEPSEINHPTVRELQPNDLMVSHIGAPSIISPLVGLTRQFISDQCRVILQPKIVADTPIPLSPLSFELAGPRERLYFNPPQTTCGIVTCGGLCPGLNDVIRSLTLTLLHSYGVRKVIGFRYGYNGLSANPLLEPMELTAEQVDDIQDEAGTILGSSRGPEDPDEMVATLVNHKVNVLFTIGGDGTLRGAHAIVESIQRQGLPISVVGIPKTIDNDLSWVERSFGFSTAVKEAAEAVQAAHTEAHGAWNGIGLVKLMGRHSGFIAAHACLATSCVNYCLIPEVPFTLTGEHGLLQSLEKRLAKKAHAVIVVAEGAGQELLTNSNPEERDASGNLKLKDIGLFLKSEIKEHLKNQGTPHSIKYIDPSYIIRSQPTNSVDSEFCLILGQMAAHAGLAGKTDLVVGFWNSRATYVPIPAVAGQRKQVDPEGHIWQAVLGATEQPSRLA